MEAVARRALAEVYLLGGDLDRAEGEALRAVEIASAMPPIRAHALATLGGVLGRRGRTEGALAAAQHAAQLLGELGSMVQGEACVRVALVEALAAASREEEARAALASAHAWLQSRADGIDAGERRERFLREVPDHARILALWEHAEALTGRRAGAQRAPGS